MRSRFANLPCISLTVLLVGGLALPAIGQTATQNETRPIDPLRYEEAIAAFEAEDAVSRPRQDAIVITGSSSIRRWHPSIREDLAPLTVIPRGFGGSTMQDVLHYIDRLAITYRPRAIVIYEGDNDTGSFFVPPETIVEQFKQIVGKVHAALPTTRIYVLSVKPSVSRRAVWAKALETNEMLKTVVASNDLLSYIDVATPFLDANGDVMTDIFVEDDLHLNEKGTRIWAATIRDALMAGEAHHRRPYVTGSNRLPVT
jgi:lysophospholipase L1-like esterase